MAHKKAPTLSTLQPDIFALDLGTTKFCLATLRWPQDTSTPEMEKVVVPAGGMKRGMVSHMHEAQKAIDHLLSLAEQKFQKDIKQIYLGVAGSHLRGRIATATLDLGGDIITEDDQNTILQKCAQPLDSAYEVLHNIPITYQVDARELADCAIGFSGDFIKGESFVIEADKNYLKDLIRLCNACGLTVAKLYAEPYASAMVTVPYEHRQQGVVVADIGGGTTDGIVFKGGKPIKLFTVNVGGQLMTRDLATCLRISINDAHHIKHHFGLEYCSPDPTVTSLPIPQITGCSIDVHAAHVYKILSCRIMELYQLMMKELGPLQQLLTAGMIITGGGSSLKNIGSFISRHNNICVSKNKPSLPKITNHSVTPDHRISSSPPYATVAGILYLAWQHHEQQPPVIHSKASYHLRSFISWLKEIA